MKDPRFEVYPQSDNDRGSTDSGFDEQFYWRFRDGNGRITFIGGEGFTRREDAHRAVIGACGDVMAAIFSLTPASAVAILDNEARGRPPIVDVDE